MEIRPLRFTLAVALCAGLVLTAGAATWQGTVFHDANANGRLDPGEAGVAGVAVSNGADVVRTDAAGRYLLEGEGEGFVFVVKPRDWRIPVDARNLPVHHRRVAGVPVLPPGAMDFPLRPAGESGTFRALILADTQVGSEREIGYLDRTMIDGLAGVRDIAFGVTLGDVVNDRPELYEALNRSIARIGVPWYPLLGNHDLDFAALEDRGSAATFEKVYGPSTYAFQFGQVLFVALNNVRHQGGMRYLGGLTDGQFGFIERLLAGTPRETFLVVMMHIPWFYNDPANNQTFRLADRARLFGLIEGWPNLLLLSGHSHYQRHVFHTAADGWRGGAPLHEYNVAAASGGFWGGPPDANGIPVATQWDGTPHGYAILTFDGLKPPQMDYRAARRAADDQIGLWGPAVVALKQSYVSYFANVFNGHEGWKVEARVDDRRFTPMRKVVDWDPAYAAQYLAQDNGPAPAPAPRLPDPLVNYHLWRAYLPADLTAGTHTMEVRATDPAGKVYSAKRSVMIK